MKKYLLLTYCLFSVAGFCIGQNLVPNPSFEEYDTCQTGLGQIYRVLYWTKPIPTCSPDYFNACNSNPNWSVPMNVWGYETPHTGIAYMAISIARLGSVNPMYPNTFREYIETGLTDTLVTGSEYCVKFHVSACDSFNYVSNDIGILFSKEQIFDTCNQCTLPYVPQFENNNDLSNRVGWTEVSGSYLATGGEKYITIGNFKDTNTTVATYTGWVQPQPFRAEAVYYIDDVSVMLCDTSTGVIRNKKNISLKVYPNPSAGVFYLEFKNSEAVNLEIFDAFSNLIYRRTGYRNKDSPINLSNYEDGIYLLKVSTDNSFHSFKLIKIKQ